MFSTLNWSESYCLKFKEDIVQFTAGNYILCVSVYVSC